MTDSQQLLQAYATQGSEAAFRELVGRYINFVYSTARRLLDGNTQLAEDVTQTVFINLARQARSISSAVALGGWLHQHTFHVATKALRTEQRREARERKALEMTMLQDDANDSWEKIAPSLDEAINQLGRDDRLAILLRFFEKRDFQSVGRALGSSEDAARMRVQRALGKLQGLLSHQGSSLSAAGLAAALAANAVSAAPIGLAAATASLAMASATTSAGILLTLMKVTSTLPLKLSLAALLLVGMGSSLVIQSRSRVRQQNEIQSLLQQVSALTDANGSLSNSLERASRTRVPKLPAPPVAAAAPLPPPSNELSSSLYSLITNKNTKLTPGQLTEYLQANRRSASSLLAAFRTTGDQALLSEAMQSFPEHPQVSFEAALRKDVSPEERRHWLDTLKTAAPENALASYLSAADYFKSGQTDQAVQELIAAEKKKEFKDYSLDRVQDDEDAYRAAGYSVAESKLVANQQLLLPQLVQFKELSGSILELAGSYRQNGDEASRQAALEMAVNLGRRYSEPAPGETLISQLLGVAVERSALAAMDPQAVVDASGQTARERIDELTQRRAAIRELNRQADPIWHSLSDQDWISYNSRSLAFGEQAALQWLVSKNAQP